jgi:hypothetical protein
MQYPGYSIWLAEGIDIADDVSHDTTISFTMPEKDVWVHAATES